MHEQGVLGESVEALGSSIMVLFQDQRGHHWFGSWESGVYRYDGESLVHYTSEHGLPNMRVDEIKEDAAGNVYFASCHPTSTVTKFDGQTFTILKPRLSEDWKLEDGDVWFRHAYPSEKVYRYDGINLWELQLPKPSGLSNPFEIYSIYQDRMGNIWFGSNPVGVCRYDGKSFDWITEEDVTEFRDEGANGVRSILEDANGDFWFNTEYRYSVYNKAASHSAKFYTRTASIGSLDGKKEGQLDEYLSCTIDDRQQLWFVTYRDGVWKYDGSEISHYPVRHQGKDITLFSIYKDKQGDLWLGTHENGAYKWNGSGFVPFIP